MASVQFQDILYRKCLPEDIDLIMELNDSLRPGLVTYDATYRFLTAPDHWLYAAIYQGRILGLLYGYALSRLDRPQAMLYIHELAVVPAFQRQIRNTKRVAAVYNLIVFFAEHAHLPLPLYCFLLIVRRGIRVHQIQKIRKIVFPHR